MCIGQYLYVDDMSGITLSALELPTIQAGGRVVDTLRDTAGFAQELERLGYRRVWYDRP